MNRVFLALGSNLGDRGQYLQRAVTALAGPELRIVVVSPVYETAPRGYLEQDWFLNLALQAETSLTPVELLQRCRNVEKELLRSRTIPNGPRTIDIDILLFNDLEMNTPELQIPHPRYRERRFVLEPLARIAPELRDPVTRIGIAEMLAKTEQQEIRQSSKTISLDPPV